MLAAAPGSSRCSGSGSFLASARGCRPPALVDCVSRCFVVSLEVFDAWLPPRRRRRVAPPATTSKRVSGRRPRAARMSICAPSVAANSSAAAARLNHLARGISASPARAQARRKSRSEATRRRAAGCTTLTATRSPRRPPFVTSFLRTCVFVPRSPRAVAATPKNKTLPRTAECTWATQPVPTGAASTSSTSRQSGPSDASRARSVSRHACAGARSCKWAKRSQNARGKRSSRDEAHCASLTAVGPAARVAQRQ